MRPASDESAIETPLVLLILILVGAPLIFFGVRHEMKVRAETRAQARRESTYQAVLRSYSQILKPGAKRKEVEDYLRVTKTEFLRMSLDDLVKVGEEEPPWYCGTSGVYVRFRFTSVGQRDPQLGADDEDRLDDVAIYHWLDRCL